ncbi:MAG TPA: hypothetical protein VGT41_04675 [Candidatus Babeliales bacterium]|nr:hypothetical protein [Candidatus Babeliales bacterium]
MRILYTGWAIVLCGIVSCPVYTKDSKDTSFDQAVQAIIKEKPQIIAQAEKIKQKPVLWYTYEEMRKSIDAVAALYLLWRVANIYYYTYHAPMLITQENIILRGLRYIGGGSLPSLIGVHLIPQSLQVFITYFGFARAVVLVALEIIIYKTVAKVILYCCYADLFDVVEQGAIRIKRLISAFLL